MLTLKEEMKKGFKVADTNRTKLVGVACSSLKELIEKGKRKLAMEEEEEEEITVALGDGTIVDDEDYFQGLPAQTVLILYRRDENILTGVDFVLDVLRRMNSTYLRTGRKAREVLLDKTHDLIDLLREEDDKEARKNTREEDPEWFSGLETNSRTKDEYMYRKAQDRIRGYLYKFQEDLRKSSIYLRNSEARRIIQEGLTVFKAQLKGDGYFGCYFDRRCAPSPKKMMTQGTRGEEEEDEKEEKAPPLRKKMKTKQFDETRKCQSYDRFSYCDASGKFVCQGKWKVPKCEFAPEHRINPYASRKTRIIFSTWNLDHRIERSRSVAPTFLKAVESCGCGKSQSLNFMYFYQLLFTKINLKLVHVVCHDKSIHDVSCDSKLVYI